jgi:hypothetical protein
MDFEQRFEKKIELIQNTLALGFAKNAETDRVLDRVARRLDDVARRLDDVVKRLDHVVKRLDDVVKRQDKADRQIKGLQTLTKFGMRMLVKIDQNQKRTDEKLNRWIAAIQSPNGHKGRNGHKNGPNGRKKGNGLN